MIKDKVLEELAKEPTIFYNENGEIRVNTALMAERVNIAIELTEKLTREDVFRNSKKHKQGQEEKKLVDLKEEEIFKAIDELKPTGEVESGDHMIQVITWKAFLKFKKDLKSRIGEKK